MKVLILNAGKGWGGIEAHSVTLATALRGHGHKVIIGCSNDGFVKANAEKAGIPTSNIKVANSGDILAVSKMVRLVLKEDIDVIIANLGKEYWPAAVVASLLGKRFFPVRHQCDELKGSTVWMIARYAEKVIAVSCAVKEALTDSGVPAEMIEVVYNAVDLEVFRPSAEEGAAARDELGIGKDEVVIGFAGKLHEGKGVFELLRAFKGVSGKYPGTMLLFVGQGPARQGLEEETRALSIEGRVVFAGLRNDMRRMYAAMDIFVLPSTCPEAFGMVLAEAMAMCRPVIGTAAGGMPEVIDHEKEGLIVQPGDVEGLRSAMVRYIDDPGFAGAMASGGRKRVEECFSVASLGEAFERLFLKRCQR